jgi:hypothetical protein
MEEYGRYKQHFAIDEVPGLVFGYRIQYKRLFVGVIVSEKNPVSTIHLGFHQHQCQAVEGII